MERGAGSDVPGRDLYCVVPADLAPQLHEPLRRHFAAEPAIHVIVERREADRRRLATRRAATAPTADSAPADDRRRVRSDEGRRAGERRVVPDGVSLPPLPRKARPYAERLHFVALARLADPPAADVEANRAIARFQAGDIEAFSELYLRYFDRVYAYMRVALRDQDEAEDTVQQVFTHVFEALPRYEIRGTKPFRAWLFRIARNDLLKVFDKGRRLLVVDPEKVDRDREGEDTQALDTTLAWISDHELLLFVERLPEPQQQALALRYMLGLSTEEIAQVLNREPASVRQLQSRALRFLEQRLTAIGRAPRRGSWDPALVLLRQAPVLRSRRFALTP